MSAGSSCSVSFSDFVQMSLDVFLAELTEVGIVASNDSDFDLGRLEVEGEDGGEARDGQLNGFVVGVFRLLLELLLQVAVGFGLLDAHGDGAEAAVVASWISLVDARTQLLVEADEDHGAAEWPHLSVLRVDLGDVGDATAQNVDGHFVAVLVLPVGGFVLSALHLRLAVGELSCHDTADAFRDSVQVTDGVGVDELVRDLLLGRYDCDVLSLESHRGVSLLVDCFESIF
jgi:hypothetical protein